MYCDFAYVYDHLIRDVNYVQWADYLEILFEKYRHTKPELILDLACGTGNLTLEMANRGYDMIGIDISPDMLSCAMGKTPEGASVLWVCQDMRDFELYGTMDVILCTMDSLNYMLEKSDLKKVFQLVRNYLNPEGLFIFDMNTPYKLEHILNNHFYYEIGEDITYLWENQYNQDTGVCTFDLTFFVRESRDKYIRLEEQQQQKSWCIQEIQQALRESDMHFLNVFDAFTQQPPAEKAERCFFVAGV